MKTMKRITMLKMMAQCSTPSENIIFYPSRVFKAYLSMTYRPDNHGKEYSPSRPENSRIHRLHEYDNH